MGNWLNKLCYIRSMDYELELSVAPRGMLLMSEVKKKVVW